MSSVAKLIEADAQRLHELGFANLDPIRRRKVLRRLASIAGVPEQDIELVLRRAAPRALRREADDERAAAAVSQPIPRGPAEQAIGALLAQPTLFHELRDEEIGALEAHNFSHPAVAEVAHTLFALLHEGDACAMSTLELAMPSTPSRNAMRALTIEVEHACEGDSKRLLAFLRDAAVKLDVAALRRASNDPHDRLAHTRGVHARLGKNPVAFPRPSALSPPT
jgi:hypothetical protein